MPADCRQLAHCRQLTAAGVRWYELVGERYSFDGSDLSGAVFDKTSLYASAFDNAMAMGTSFVGSNLEFTSRGEPPSSN